jgi:phosphate/sulfate permease
MIRFICTQVMKTIGYKLTVLSPTRGASAELAASLTVVSASYVGLPVSAQPSIFILDAEVLFIIDMRRYIQVSTTQCIVGAVSGIGCIEGWRTVQWRSLAKVCVSWVLVFFTAAVLSTGMFSICYYSPSAMDPVVVNATVV